MFWPIMLGLKGPLKKCRYFFWKSLFVGHQTAHTAIIAWDPNSVESDGFLGSGEGENNPDSEDYDFE